jgi:hypothetical protein
VEGCKIEVSAQFQRPDGRGCRRRPSPGEKEGKGYKEEEFRSVCCCSSGNRIGSIRLGGMLAMEATSAKGNPVNPGSCCSAGTHSNGEKSATPDSYVPYMPFPIFSVFLSSLLVPMDAWCCRGPAVPWSSTPQGSRILGWLRQREITWGTGTYCLLRRRPSGLSHCLFWTSFCQCL